MVDDTRHNTAKLDSEVHSAVLCSQICVDYRELRALDDITGRFLEGSLTAIVGPNGGGKSTFLRALAGLQPLASGSIEIACKNASRIAYLPQTPDIDRSFPITVGDVVGMGLSSRVGFFSAFSPQDLALIHQALDNVGLDGYLDRPIHSLSGGQFQRVLFARISLQDAPVILLDEPFAAIDASTMDILMDVLGRWQSQGKTIITVLHDMDIVRDYFPDTLILARSVVAWGNTADALTRDNLKQAKVCCRAWEAMDEPQNTKKQKLKTSIVGA